METLNLINQVYQSVERAYVWAESQFNKTFPRPSIKFDLVGKTAGQVIYGKNLIRINPALLTSNSDYIINQTAPHEAFHLIARHIYGPYMRGHGPKWKSLMRGYGLTPNRCHSLQTTPARVRQKVLYSCFCRAEIKVDISIHNRIVKGSDYFCKKCQHKIQPKINQIKVDQINGLIKIS